MKGNEEIQQELARLKDMAPRIRQESAFGDDNRASIEAQIEALSEEMTDLDCDDKERDEEWTPDEASAARDAIFWRDDDGDMPSDGWKSLLPK